MTDSSFARVSSIFLALREALYQSFHIQWNSHADHILNINAHLMLPNAHIISRSSRLPEPDDLYSGASSSLSNLPREILLIWRAETPLDEPIWVHNRFVLVICLTGVGTLIIDEKIHYVQPDRGMLIFPHQCHHIVRMSEQDTSWLFVTFDGGDPESLASLRNLQFKYTETCWHFLETIIDCYHAFLSRDMGKGQQISFWLGLLLNELLQSELCVAQLHKSMPQSQTRPWQTVRRTVQYICRHIQEPLELSEVARHVAISESHLRRTFQKTMGISLGEFIRKYRIQQACALLSGSTMNVTEVGQSCGFNSPFSFSRSFKNAVGISPLEYRKAQHRRLDVP